MTHVVVCPLCPAQPMDGWIDAQEVRKLHNRRDGHDACVEVFTREWAQRLGMNT